MKQLYIFSGLGADERVFRDIDFSGYHTTFIRWELPGKKETIKAYAGRLATQITTKNPILIGLSFGGIIAIEVSKLLAVERVIIIASVKTRDEIPAPYRLLAPLKLYRLMPSILFLRSNPITQWMFGTEDEDDKQLLKMILHDTSPVFFRWAIDRIANWDNQVTPINITHIHGSNDRIFPIENVSCDIRVQGGGHFMTVNKAEEVSRILREVLGVNSI